MLQCVADYAQGVGCPWYTGCEMIMCIAVFYSVLQGVALSCSVVPCCSVLQCVVGLMCVAVCCRVGGGGETCWLEAAE